MVKIDTKKGCEIMSKLYGVCRVSTKKQNIERQIRNIQEYYPNAIIVQDKFTGTKIEGREEFEKFAKKYQTFSKDRTIDNCMNKLGMEPEDFSDYEKGHAAEIKKITENNKTPIIDSNTGRYKSYDDPTNFPQ